MSGVPFLALGLIAAGLAGVLAWELQPTKESPATTTIRPPATSVGPRTIVAGNANQWAATSLARPLFNLSRRPAAAEAADPVANEPLPRLTGTLVSSTGRGAIFAGQPQPLVLQEGGRLGQFTVQSIEPGQVTLRGPDGLRMLRPSFNPAGAPAPGAPTPGATAGAAPPASPFGTPPPTLPGARPVVGGEGPPIPGTSPAPADAPQSVMPFDQNPAPSGLDIIRNETQRAPKGTGR